MNKIDNCQFCEDFIGTDKSSQIIHFFEKHDDVVDLYNHKCLKCHVKFEDIDELLKHVILTKENNCSLCSSPLQEDPNDHYRTCHQDYVEKHWGKCDICDGYFMPKYSRFHQHCNVVRKPRKRKWPGYHPKLDITVPPVNWKLSYRMTPLTKQSKVCKPKRKYQFL